MKMKKIIGLDIGTNSIGWALVEKDDENKKGNILGMGCRIISLGEDKTNFEQGKALTRNADRRTARSGRKLNKRYKQRRNKLIYVLNELGILPDYIQWEGNFPEPNKIQQLSIKPIPKQSRQLNALELFELRSKALYEKIEEKDFGRLIYLFNQLRGYAGGGDDEDEKQDKKDGEHEVEKDTVKNELQTLVCAAKPGTKYKTENIKKGKTEIPLFYVELEDLQTLKKYAGECYKDVSGLEIPVEVIKKSDVDKFVFFNVYDTEHKRSKPKKGGSSENITARILKCERRQEYHNKKWMYFLTVTGKDESGNDKKMSGTVALKHTNQADDFKPGEEKELQVITKTDENGNETYEFALPVKSHWRKEMETLEKDLDEQEIKLNENIPANEEYKTLHLGEYYYNELKKDKWFKVRTRIILRKRYQSEFDAIWEKQVEENEDFRKKINDKDLLKKVVDYLFPGNNYKQDYKKEALEGGFYHLIRNQIIYYQRPLKPQFKLIGICQYENGKTKETTPALKVIPESHPLQEERKIWEQINKLSINTPSGEGENKSYFERYLTPDEKATLYDILQEKKEFSHNQIRNQFKLQNNIDWLNGLYHTAKLKGNSTLIDIKNKLNSLHEGLFEKLGLNEPENLIAFWRILYNWIKKEYDNQIIDNEHYEKNYSSYHEYNPDDDNEYDVNSARVKAISEFLKKHLKEDVSIESIAKIRFKRTYKSLSEKAIRNLLPLLRSGKYYDANSLPEKAKVNIKLLEDNAEDILERLKEGETDTPFEKSLLEHFLDEKIKSQFYEGGLMYSDAATLIYGKHTATETKVEDAIKEPKSIKPLEQGSLRNPVVEQITNETLKLIKSIWEQYGFKPEEIRVELARELKNNKDEREKITKGISDNEKRNNYARQRLMDLKKNLPSEDTVKLNPNPTLSNIGTYKIWCQQITKENEKEPDRKEIQLYRLWSDQNHLSPYTKKPIPLSRLFSKYYQVDHIIPSSRYFDDSMTNKVVS